MATNLPLSSWAFVQANENFIFQFDYDGNGNMIYQGWAQPGTATSESVWKLKKFTYNGLNQLTSTSFPQVSGVPSAAFSFIWDNRTTYTFS